MRTRRSSAILVLLAFALALESSWFSLPITLVPSVLAETPVFSDNFDDNTTNSLLWTTFVLGTGPTVAEANQRLEITHPASSTDDPALRGFGAGYAGVCKLRGDFDIQVDYYLLVWPAYNGVRVGIKTELGTVERTSAVFFPEVYLTNFGTIAGMTATSDLSGKLRQKRAGNIVTGYYFSSGNWVALSSSTTTTADISFLLYSWSHDYAFGDQNVKVAFDNLAIIEGQLICPNRTPTAQAGGPYTLPEGGSTTLNGFGYDPDGDPLAYAWDLDNNGTFETPGQNVTFPAIGRDGPSSQTAVLRVCDDKAACAISSTTVSITNVAPFVGPIIAPVAPIAVGTTVSATANFTDPGILDTHTGNWNWGDGNVSPAAISETNGSGSANGSHTYTAAGIYSTTLTVTDKDGGAGQSVFRYVVVYDPTAGFVTGGGWINSPAGAYSPNPSLTGKASFGFVAKYQRGATTPSGQTQFTFHVADMDFHSTGYQWMVIAGAKAQYKGSGKINGTGDYGFMLTAIDGQLPGGGDTHKFRIKIWDKSSGNIVYDNQMGADESADPTTAIGGGSIVIHKQ